ncbi:MAG: hypothetical protein GY940_04470 [bacterium]|nr:hypothetical protein [bacterium]
MAGKNIGGAIKDLLVVGTVGYVAGSMMDDSMFSTGSSKKFGFALLLGGFAFMSTIGKDRTGHYKYKNYTISKLHGKKHEYKRKKILAKLKKHSWRK